MNKKYANKAFALGVDLQSWAFVGPNKHRQLWYAKVMYDILATTERQWLSAKVAA